MRHTQTKPNSKSSDVLTNLKIPDTSQKSVGASKRIGCDLREQGAKKNRKLEVSEAAYRKVTVHKSKAGSEKHQKKCNPPLGKKLIVKKVKKPNEKYKKIGPKIDKKPKKTRKILKKLGRPLDKKEEHEGPPTLCETFSRITTMVAETVINEKENQKLAENSLAKMKKEFSPNDKTKREVSENSVTKSNKGDANTVDASTSKVKKEIVGSCETHVVKAKKEFSKSSIENKKAKSVCPKNKAGLEKPKAKMKTDRGTKLSNVKKFSEKSLAELLPKVMKEDENSGIYSKGINSRRVSAPGTPENEKEIEIKLDCEKHKVYQSKIISGIKNLNVTKITEKSKSEKKAQALGATTTKRRDNSRAKSESKEKKPKIHNNQSQIKKLVDELRKSLDKDVDLRPQESSPKKGNKKANVQKTKQKKSKFLLKMNCENSRNGRKPVKKNGKISAKLVKSKMGSETDGSNSDELTLNILQRKAKKYEKNETSMSASRIKSETSCSNIQEEVKIKMEGKPDFAEKLLGDKSSKNKKVKVEKIDTDEEDNMSISEKKIFGEIMKKRSKEVDSDTDEDLEFQNLLAKKLAKNIEMENSHKVKRKRVENNQSDSEQRARRLRLFGFWSGPKRHRVASLNALAKVHCLYENESKGVMAEIEKMGEILKADGKSEKKVTKKKDRKMASGETKREFEESGMEKLDSIVINKRTLRGTPGTRGAGKHWDMFAAEFTTSTSCASSDESHSDTDASKRRPLPLLPSYRQKMQKKEENGKGEILKIPKRRRKADIGITMDLKDMVVRKRMASLNASAILAASYSSEKRSTRKDSSGTSTEDGLSSPDDARVDDRYLSADESDSGNGKKSCAGESFDADNGTAVDRSRESQAASRGEEHRRRKNFWKTKVENLKKASKEKRNSPSPILADFGVERDLSVTVMEKEQKDEIKDDREKEKGKGNCKITYTKKYLESNLKVRDKYGDAGKAKTVKERDSKREKCRKEEKSLSRKRFVKRRAKDDEIKNINIEKVSDSEKGDEYEYKSDSDNGQRKLIELRNTGGSNKKVAVIVNQDTDVTITGVYVNSTRSTHHEGFCSIAGMQYRISSTSHTQTEATAVLKTSTASEQTPPPTEPTNCSSPRNHKSYTPLSALSNMQPPAGAPPHSHLPPPPPPHLHHYHHHCSISQHRPPPDHYISHGPPQGPTSPLGRRHGCSSAFSAPHCSSQLPPSNRSSPTREDEAFGHPLPSHGYFQPAGPLIHHHTSNPAVKIQNVSAIDLNSAGESQGPGSGNEDVSDSTRSGDNPPPSGATNHMGYPRGYPTYQGAYYQGGYYAPPPPPQSSHYQPPPPAFHHYHHPQDFCYTPGYPPSSYPPPATYRRFLQPAPGYFTSEVTYSSSVSPISQDHGTQQMIVPGSPSSSYAAPLDPYPPAAPYYAGYSGSGPACYTHPPSSRNLAFIEQTYQTCPCPMQSCPKNVHIGPLTGECKRPGALPLPPVALQLPQEPPGAAGPPSPARGSAGMPPLPSPVSNSARPNCGPSWDGRVTKSTALEPCSDIKWDETKARLDVNSQCKSEVLYSESNGMWNPTDIKISNTTRYLRKTDPVDNKWEVLNQEEKSLPPPEAFSQRQGLLAISSPGFSKIPIWNEQQAESNPKGEENVKVKAENENLSIESSEPIKKKNNSGERKRKSNGEDARRNRKRKKSTEEEATVAAVNVGSDNAFQGSKRKNESLDENGENKVKNMKKKPVTNHKDENEVENVVANAKKSQKNALNPKAKLLKDRNETVSACDTVSEVIEQVIKGQTLRKKKKTEDVMMVSDKISNRRRSNQEKWTMILAESLCPRKSRSCSPNGSARDREESTSPWRSTKEDLKRRTAEQSSGKTTKNAKSKTETRSRERNGQEHSRTSKSSKRNSGASIMSKTKNGVSILGKSSHGVGCLSSGTKSKRTKCDSSTSASSKKFHMSKMLSISPRSGISPKWSNGWSWDSESFDAKVYLTNDEPPVVRKCYSAMRHVEGDVIQPKDCVLLKAGPRKIDLPFVAKVAALWENPEDGEMMVSLLWYYRPEHTDQGRQSWDQQDEIFASRHKDINSVACIEDKCFVLTYNEYCRYRKKVKRLEEGIVEKNLHVPLPEQPYPRLHRLPPCVMAPDMVFFCRKVYDFRQKRLLKNPM